MTRFTAAPRRAWQSVWRAAESARYVSAFLASPITADEALARTRQRLAERSEAFLDAAERLIFGHAGSAYRPLLEAGGYDRPRLRALIRDRGLEEGLRQLQHDGVYVTIEEFKGLRPARRAGRTLRLAEEGFRNPHIRSGLRAPSGGTRGPALWNTISLGNHRMGAEHLALALEAYGLRSAPVAVWLAQAHGATSWAVLALAALGHPPGPWFTHIGPAPWPSRLFARVARDVARLRGRVIRGTTLVPLGQEGPVLQWARSTGTGGCGILTTPSLALRLALAARAARQTLDGVTFVTIAEPLTETKLRHIRAAGARAFSSLGFTEFGRATYGCPAAGGDESHVCRDAVAVIGYARRVDAWGGQVQGLLFTSLRPDARRVLLNVETGDYADILPAGCGCPLERLGWTERLRDIRSFEKLNAEGRLFYGTQLIELVEQMLPERCGGDPTDYQLVEQEDDQGFTRLSVFVHPRLDGVAAAEVQEIVEGVLHSRDAASAAVWGSAGTVRVVRAAPLLTSAGKLMPLHHLT